MKRNTLRVCTAAASLAALSVLPLTAHAEYKCASPNGSIEQRACAMAAAGPDALRRFVERTRNIYLLYYYDYARPAA